MKSFTSNTISIVFLTLTLVATGCAHTEKKVDQKIAAEPAVKNANELGEQAHALIESNANLSPDQKEKLFALQKETHEKLIELRDQSLKIRSLIIQEVTSEKYNESVVNVLKNKLKKNENEKLSTYFRAIHKVNVIFGRKSQRERREELMREMMDIHSPS